MITDKTVQELLQDFCNTKQKISKLIKKKWGKGEEKWFIFH